MKETEYTKFIEDINNLISEYKYHNREEPTRFFISVKKSNDLIDYCREIWYANKPFELFYNGDLKIYGIKICRSHDLEYDDIFAA